MSIFYLLFSIYKSWQSSCHKSNAWRKRKRCHQTVNLIRLYVPLQLAILTLIYCKPHFIWSRPSGPEVVSVFQNVTYKLARFVWKCSQVQSCKTSSTETVIFTFFYIWFYLFEHITNRAFYIWGACWRMNDAVSITTLELSIHPSGLLFQTHSSKS